MNRSKNRRVWAATAVAVAVMFSAACSNQSSSTPDASAGTASGSGGSGKAPDGVMIAKLLGPSYFKATFKGAQEAADALGGKLTTTGPSTPTAAAQIPLINAAISQGVPGIMIGGDDPNALAPSLKQAMAQGIKVVTFDSDVAVDARQMFLNQAKADEVAKAVDKALADSVGPAGGQVAIISSTPTNTNQNTWIDVMKPDLEQNYPNLKLVKIAYGNDAPDQIATVVQNLYQSYPDLKGIAAITGVALPAAAAAMENLKLGGKIALTGVDVPSDMKKYVEDGTVKSFVLWDAVALGKLSYYALAALENGSITGKEGDKFTAGDLGEFTVGKNGEVILGPPTVFDSSNINNYDF